MAKQSASIALIESRILEIRGHRVMLDADLAELHGVRTKVLLQSVKRNAERFPADFLFVLTEQEVTSCFASERWGGRRTLRAFVRLRPLAVMNVELARKLVELERKVAAQGEDIAGIVRVIRQLAASPEAAEAPHRFRRVKNVVCP